MAELTGRSRPGGRTARTREAVHAAVRGLIEERGAAGVQVADVAARSGVHPATVYRRWGSARALVLEVVVAGVDDAGTIEATGDLRHDLLAYGRRLAADLDTPGGFALLQALAAAAQDPDVGPAGATALVAPRLARIQQMLDAGGGTLDAVDVIDGLLAPIALRALLSRPSSLGADDLARLVDALVLVAEHRRAGR